MILFLNLLIILLFYDNVYNKYNKLNHSMLIMQHIAELVKRIPTNFIAIDFSFDICIV